MAAEEITSKTGLAFQKMVHTYNICMQRTLNKYGLYPGQPQLMFAIRDLDTPTQNELAVKLSVSKASVGVSLRRLESSGFVKRVRDKNDTRCIRITLTKKGHEYVRWCDIDYQVLFTTMLEGFTGDEKERICNTFEKMDTSLAELRGRLES